MRLILLAALTASALLAQNVPPPTPPAAVKQPTQEPAPARLLEIKTVYLLKMARGLHQYLSHQLTAGKVFIVTTDPSRADALLTDRLGKDFEDEVAALFPLPDAEPSKDESSQETHATPSLKGDKAPQSTWGRGRGTVFLVDRPTGDVLWSHYAPSASSRSEDMETTAKKLANKLKDDVEQLRNPSKKGFFGK